jgi:formylglycine-generating enzyme
MIDFVRIPGDRFPMGQADGRDEERPVHWVEIRPFLLGRYQVTNAEYGAFLQATGREAPPEKFPDPNQAVVAVSWFDAVAYCEWLSAKSGQAIRLPTEAEWEFAARGGLENALFPWGNEAPAQRHGYAERWLAGPEPVGTSSPNGYGLFDMCENVHEWCSDWFDPRYYAVSPESNPGGPISGTRRASRGGSWRHSVKIARCAARSSIPPEFRYADYGFRVAGNAD